MKSLKNSLGVVLLFGFALTINVVICFEASKDQLPLTSWKITILNLLKNDTLSAHCKSKDNDLGEHLIEIGKSYEWEFKENFFRRTLFWCNFRNRAEHASFEVFWPEKEKEKGTWLSDHCTVSKCVWVAESKGFSLYNAAQMKFDFVHPWEPNSS